MAFANSSNRDRTCMAEINVTPLVDVMLVLLIIFMIAAPLMQPSLEVNVPEVDSKNITHKEKDDTTLTLNREGEVFLNGDKSIRYNSVNIEDKLRKIYQDKAKKEIYIQADKSIPYGHVVKLMALCKNIGIEKVGLITQPES